MGTMTNTNPVRGTRDILPNEVALRDRVQQSIFDTYKSWGYSHIEIPCLEHIELLQSGEGGENEKLIFKVLKRGEKLDLHKPDLVENDLVDCGLRYDLTVPLARYVANKVGNIDLPFKVVQIGPVWRAERPQRGRFRQFTQCDIDIIGDTTICAEVDLIAATADSLSKIGFDDFTIRINDRRLLHALAEHCGFPDGLHDKLFVVLDKIDKIGEIEVKESLVSSGFEAKSTDMIMSLLREIGNECDLSVYNRILKGNVHAEVLQDMQFVVETISSLSSNAYRIVFDPTLVRGMGYYTGQIFEVSYKDYPFSIAGGGRYDKMIGKLIGKDIAACGFSIGFERVITILNEENNKNPDEQKIVALIIEDEEQLITTLHWARQLQKQGFYVSILRRAKKHNKQLNALYKQGITWVSYARPDGSHTDVEPIRLRDSAVE